MTPYFISVCLEVIHKEGTLWEESGARVFKGIVWSICNEESLSNGPASRSLEGAINSKEHIQRSSDTNEGLAIPLLCYLLLQVEELGGRRRTPRPKAQKDKESPWDFILTQWSPTFLAPGSGLVEDNFSTDQGGDMRGWFWDDSNALHLLCTLFLLPLHQLHLRSSGIGSQRLGTPVLKYQWHCAIGLRLK